VSTRELMWSDRTWEEIPSDLSVSSHAAILPVGATEQHGPHLGCGMDTVLADVLVREVSKRVPILVLPTVSYGCSLGHSQRWPGTIALDPLLLTNLCTQIGSQAYISGVRRLFIINSHVTNAAPLRCALEMLRARHDDLMVAVINTAQISERIRDAHFQDAEDWHANRAETSLMQAIAPNLVRENKVAEADDQDRTRGLIFSHPVNRTSLNGVTGRPSDATKAEGETLFGWMVEDLTNLVVRGCRETPPLANSYVAKPNSQS
jgi:creatinine amidohydrolase